MQAYNSPEWTDDILLDLIRFKDDRAAFSELYNRYWKLLNNTAFKRLKSIEAAEEAVQDVFMDFFLNRREIKINSNLEAYLKMALKFKVFRIYRSQQLHHSHLERLTQEYQIQPDLPDAQLDNKLLREKIYEVAGRMPDKCREVFLLSRFEQLSNQAIADRLNISVSTVKKHITKAMSIMRKEFHPQQLDLLAFCMLFFLER